MRRFDRMRVGKGDQTFSIYFAGVFPSYAVSELADADDFVMRNNVPP